jgi:PAS domain S-box-containing protein
MPSNSKPYDSRRDTLLSQLIALLTRLLHLRPRKSSTAMPPEIRLEAVLAAMTDAVVITDKRGLFVDFNEPFAHLNRFKTKGECARVLADYPSVFEATTADGIPVQPEDWPLLRALRGETGVNVELRCARSDINAQWLGLYNYAPIQDETGAIVGAVLTGRGISEFRKSEEQLRNLSSRLHLALTSAHLGVWEWDITNNRLSWDDRMFELYGLDREQFSTVVDTWEKSIHPEDKDAAVDLLHAAVRGERDFDTEIRIIHPNGKIVYLKADGIVLRGADGTAERMLGVNADITEEKLAKNKLQKAYEEIEAKVVERTAQLEAAKIAAENANKAKDLFLATLSHELRSPLSAILSWTQLMERGVLPPEKVSVGIRTIKESVWAQNQLIGDLLDLSRISTGKLHIDRQPTDVADVLKAAIEVIRPSAEQRGLHIEEHFESYDVYISADPARLKQSFWNILSNANKFTPSGGSIIVSLRCFEDLDGHQVKISFQDTGRGIKPEFLPHLFERFSQADPSSIRVHGGMGLGLSLVKSLVELQDGTVTAESAGEGLGATFTLTFPLIANSIQLSGESLHIPSIVGSQDGEPLRGIKVLLVEDGDKTRIALGQLLATQGANVRAEASAKDGLATFKTFRPDVLVSDIAMPQEDGHSLMKKIRALEQEEGGHIPAIALTAYAEPRDREQAFSSGFQEYLNKPVDASILTSAIVKLASHGSQAGTKPAL